MWNPFKNKVTYKIPEVNSKWESRQNNPFERHIVIVREVREGYVRYGVTPYSGFFSMDYSLPIGDFHSGYLEYIKNE